MFITHLAVQQKMLRIRGWLLKKERVVDLKQILAKECVLV